METSKDHGLKEMVLDTNVSVSKAQDEKPSEPQTDGKTIAIIIAVIIGIFLFTFLGFKIYAHFNTPEVFDIDKLHQENIAGELSEEEGYMYNGFSFIFVDGLWWTEVNPPGRIVKIPLHFGPKELENISVKGALSPDFNKEDIYIAIDPNISGNKYYTLALMELNTNIVQGTQRGIITACTENTTICNDRPIINCKTANNHPVIELAIAETPKIELLGTCIKISGDGYELIKAVDKLLYIVYKVMG